MIWTRGKCELAIYVGATCVPYSLPMSEGDISRNVIGVDVDERLIVCTGESFGRAIDLRIN